MAVLTWMLVASATTLGFQRGDCINRTDYIEPWQIRPTDAKVVLQKTARSYWLAMRSKGKIVDISTTPRETTLKFKLVACPKWRDRVLERFLPVRYETAKRFKRGDCVTGSEYPWRLPHPRIPTNVAGRFGQDWVYRLGVVVQVGKKHYRIAKANINREGSINTDPSKGAYWNNLKIDEAERRHFVVDCPKYTDKLLERYPEVK